MDRPDAGAPTDQDAAHTQASCHLHDDELLLYRARKGLTASEMLAVRVHLRHCQICTDLYIDVADLANRFAARAEEP
jgi:hypothetical protein